MSDFASGWENPNPESGKGLPPQSLLEEYFRLPALIARQVKPVAGNPSVTSGYIRAIGDRYRLRGPLSSEDQHRQFLKVTWTQTTGFNENQFVEDAASSLMGQPLLEQEPTSVEVVTLTIPRGSLYSAPHDVVPQYSVPNGPANPEMPHSQVGEYLKVVRLLPVEIEVTDFATKSDAVPYVATTNATPPKNSELCLKADKANEKAKIEIELPSITDATMLSKMKWKVVKKPADTMVSEGAFGGSTPPNAELSLGSGSSIEDEILFEVQVGADGSSFTPAAKMNVRVVRDRLNWWFEPFSSDFGWRTAKPEPRADTGDYPAHKAYAYKRESLQSVYEFFKSSTAIGPSTPKANWAKPTITCFGQFHDALKTANGNNPLVDLTTLARIDTTAVTELPSFDLKYGALRSALGKQTTYPSDANPTLRATQFPERVQFATAAATAVGDANLTRARLMALWTREGSMDVSSQHTRTGYNPWPIGFGAAVSAAPASEADAKAIFIYDVAYICLGSDFLLKHSGGADNEPDLRDYPAALAHFKSTADATGGAGIGDRIISNLTVAGSAGSYTVSANGAFYEDMLILAGKHFVSVWQAEGPDATYMAYNMGVAKFNQMKATIGGGSYPERGRLGLIDWAIHYEIRSGEWDQPRDFAQKFHAYRMAFEAKYP
jgi:hypothetical protein